MARKKKEAVHNNDGTSQNTQQTSTETETLISKKVIEHIVNSSQIEQFVNVIRINTPCFKHEYQENQPFTNLHNKYIEANKHTVSCGATNDQVQKIDDSRRIDIKAILNNTLQNELSQTITRDVMFRIRSIASDNYLKDYNSLDKLKLNICKFLKKTGIKTQYQKKTKLKSTDQLINLILAESRKIDIKSYKRYEKFVICSSKTAMLLQNSHLFDHMPIETGSTNPGQPFAIGKLLGNTIYIDPHMKYDDTNIYIGAKTEKDMVGVKLFINTDSYESNSMNLEYINTLKFINSIQYTIENIGESCSDLYRKIQYNNKYLKPF